MANDLFRSLSPVFWFLRVTGGTPFFHSESSAGILGFRWCHPQTFWFAFVTLVHLSFISAQVFGGLFTLKDDSTTVDDSNINHLNIRLTNTISQARFLIDTFFLSKFIHFHLASFQNFFENLNCVDSVSPIAFADVQRARKIIVIGISVNLSWHVTFLIYGFNSIFQVHLKEPSWMLIIRILNNLMHALGQLHSNMLVIQFASLCYMVGLRFAGLTKTLQQIIVTDGTFRHTCNGWTNLTPESPNKNPPNTRTSGQNQVLPDESLSDVDRPVTAMEELRCRPLTLRLVFLKTIYLTLCGTVLTHFNKAFGLSLLFYLISKLISTSIGCHGFLHDLMHLSVGLFWIFLNVPDITGIFVLFQSADYVRGEVKKFFSSVAKISTQDLSIVERSELQTFILQVQGESIELSVCGLFKLGKQLLPAVAGTIATYMLVLFQFNQ